MSKRDNILNAALKLFVEQGEQATSMKWIAKEAKCGIGTMYNYFSSKEDLINALYLQYKTILFKSISEVLGRDIPIKQQFIDAWGKSIDFAVNHPIGYKYLEIFSHSPIISKHVTEEVNKLILPILETFEKGKREGIIKNLDTFQLVIFTTGAITACVLKNINIGGQEKQEIVLMAWDAIKS